MAGMDLDTIIKDLNRRFDSPLEEFYARRIIFWYDEDKEFEDIVSDLSLNSAKVIMLNGSNTFAVKKLICEDDTTSNFLVYSPLTFNKDDDNWLINIQIYSEEFRADLNSIWIDEMNLPSTPVIRKQIKNYKKFFRAKDRREAFSKYNKNISTAQQAHLAVMATLCGNDDIQPANIIKSVLCAGLHNEDNSIYQSFVTYNADKVFWLMVSQATGYKDGDNPSFERLAIHLLLTAASRSMHIDNLAGLRSFISIPHQAYCYDLIEEWLNSKDKHHLYEIARFVESEARLPERFNKLQLEDISAVECFPCINECLLKIIMGEINNDIIVPEKILAIVEKRRTLAWYDYLQSYFCGLVQVAKMHSFYIDNSAGFHTVEPHKIWEEYTQEYYKMDMFYRLFHLSFQKSLLISKPELDDLFKHVVDKVEGLYTHWFLGSLGQNWSTSIEDNLSEYGHILEVRQQTSFYNSNVLKAGARTFVIVSDALRYEVAASLSEQIQRENQGKVTLSSCEAIFPTVTKYGMAALLPHKRLSVEENSSSQLSVMADNISTEAKYRDKILKSKNKNSVALKYDNIISMKRADRQALVKGMDVVYIYHDKIDEASHTSDTAVFQACEEAIPEIKNLIRIIVNDFGGTRIFVTADHGFIYTYSPLSEDAKIDKTTPNAHDVEIDRRYMITKNGYKPDFMIPVKFMDGNTIYEAFAPREYVRIKKKGGGLNYVHGGISLQEMVVPVIEYQHMRTSSKAYQKNKDKIDTKPVELAILSANRKISNMIFSLNFYQTEAVSGNRKKETYLIYFTDATGKQISDTSKIIADKTSSDAQDRTFKCNFNLKNQEYSGYATYYLIITDESGLAIPQKEEFQIDIPFSIDGFDFNL